MKTRITQLIARIIGMVALFFAAKLGLDDEQKATALQYAGELAVWLVAIGAFLVDLLIHKLETGSIAAPAGTKSAPTKFNGTPLILLACLLLVSIAAGCRAAPSERFLISQHAVNARAFAQKVEPITTPTAQEWDAVKSWVRDQAEYCKQLARWAGGEPLIAGSAGN